MLIFRSSRKSNRLNSKDRTTSNQKLNDIGQNLRYSYAKNDSRLYTGGEKVKISPKKKAKKIYFWKNTIGNKNKIKPTLSYLNMKIGHANDILKTLNKNSSSKINRKPPKSGNVKEPRKNVNYKSYLISFRFRVKKLKTLQK